jgi:hypothetical protein
MAFARVTHVWENPSQGTPPFTTGLWARSEGDASIADVFALVGQTVAAYEAHLLPALNAGLGAGRVEAVCYNTDEVIEQSAGIITAAGGGQTRGPGYSFRAVLVAARPAGARNNCMYWPMPDTTYYGVTGATAGGIGDIFEDWGEDLIDNMSAGPFEWVARHYVDNDDHAESWSPVTGVNLADTVSFVQRRYR